MELKNFFAQDLQGNVIPNPTVYVYQPGTTTLVSGLQDANGNARANPFAGTAAGQIQLAAPDGEYDMRVAGVGREFTMRVRFVSVDGDKVAEAAASASSAQSARVAAEAARDAAESSSINAAASSGTAAQARDAASGSIDALYRAGTIQPVDFSNAANYQRVISTITNPDTRYDVAVVSGDFQADLRQAAVCIWGARLQNVVQQGGRVYRVRGRFATGGAAVDGNSGIGLAFDPGTGTGANVILAAAGAGWFWRANGSLTAYNFSTLSGSSDATFAFTLTSGAVSTFVAGDDLVMELTANANNVGGTLRGYKNGALQFTGTVAAIPSGRLAALARGTGAGGAFPSALRFTFSTLAASDPVQAPAVTNVAVSAGPSSSGVSIAPGVSRAASFSPVRDQNAFLRRAIPGGFDWLPVRPQIVTSPGDVTLNISLMSALFNKHPALRTASIAYVETTGNNATAVVNNQALPFLTIDAALQSAARIVVVGDGTYGAPPDYRFTQAAGGVMKLVVARNRGRVIIRQPGDALSAKTWTESAGFAGVYQATITAAAGQASWNAFAPHRVRLTDTLDEYGFNARLPYFAPPTQDAAGVAAAKTALQAAGQGWTWDGANGNKVLYVALGGANVEANKSRIEALYYTATGTDRVFCSGASLAFDGIYFDGQLMWPIEHNNAGTFVPSSVWLSNCWLINSPGYGVQPDSNCTAYLDNCRIHAPALDGLNADSTRNGSGAVARAMLAGCLVTATGDVDTYGIAQTQNRQAVSSHSGYVAAFGCIFEKSWGQEVADTGSGAGPSKSWYVGCAAMNGDTRLGANTGFGFYGANRQAWLDTCAGVAEGPNPLQLEAGASAKIFNCTFDASPVAIAPSVAPAAYTPANP